MDKICTTCHEEPDSHSFVKLCKANGVTVYYTCPANASKYHDTAGIIAHYDALLQQNGDNPWMWIFDSKGFNAKHALEISTAIELAKLITKKYATNLKKIRIIHPTIYIWSAYTILKPFLTKSLNELIEFIED